MGMVFGKINEEEPPFEILLNRTNLIADNKSASAAAKTPYVIRKYGKRYAIETEWLKKSDEKDMMKQTRSPFFALAGYIGVMKDPENEGSQKIAMTAPVAMSSKNNAINKGEKIAMTAPVAMMTASTEEEKSEDEKEMRKMQFFLPSKYDSMDKIPKPTNKDVSVKEIKPAIGAVYTFSGSFNEEIYTEKAMELAEQLRLDGITENMSNEDVKNRFQFWGFNAPFTIPFMRRNEIWIEISEQDLEGLRAKSGVNTSSSSTAEE